MKKILLGFLILLSLNGFCSSVDTVNIYSQAMNKARKCVVIVPDHKQGQLFPTLYLLHGYSGNYSDWIKKVPEIKKYADQYSIMIVCPDGDFSSWYFDSPVDSCMRYQTYIAREVPAFIEAHYPAQRKRTSRAITGLSMGGHGGLFLGFRHADFFGACGSMSGGVDLNSSKTRFDVAKRIGDSVNNAANWENYSVIHIIEYYPNDSIAVIFDCGVDDFFYDINKNLHEKMLQLHIPHDYIERPGKHTWEYWSNALPYQLLYFRNYFNQHTTIKKEKLTTKK
jgi:S-formylglutathione hydrolase FrmB